MRPTSVPPVRGVEHNCQFGSKKTAFFLIFPSPLYSSLYSRHTLLFCHVQFYLTCIVLHCSSRPSFKRLRLDPAAVPRRFACLGYTQIHSTSKMSTNAILKVPEEYSSKDLLCCSTVLERLLERILYGAEKERRVPVTAARDSVQRVHVSRWT